MSVDFDVVDIEDVLLFFGHAVKHQVWSLTQFYSVDFSQSRIGIKKCVFNKRTIVVSVSVALDGVLGPPRLVRHT